MNEPDTVRIGKHYYFYCISSYGLSGVPGGAIIMTTILLTNMGLPLEIVGLIAGIFRLIDMANTTFNVTGDVVTTMVVARSEGMMHTLGTGAETETKAA